MHEEVVKQDFSGLAQERREGKDLQSACLDRLEPFTQDAGDMAQQLRTHTEFSSQLPYRMAHNHLQLPLHASSCFWREHI